MIPLCPCPHFHFPVVTISSSMFILSEYFSFHPQGITISISFYKFFLYLPYLHSPPNARWTAYQHSFSRPLFNVDAETTSDGPWLMSEEGMTISWVENQVNHDKHIFSTISNFSSPFLFHTPPASWHMCANPKVFCLLRYISALLFPFPFISIFFLLIWLVS